MSSFPIHGDDWSSSRNFSRPFPSPLSAPASADESENDPNLPVINTDAQSARPTFTEFCPPPKRFHKLETRTVFGEVESTSSTLTNTRKPLPILPSQSDSKALTRSLSSNAGSEPRMLPFRGFPSRQRSHTERQRCIPSPQERQRLSKERPRLTKSRHSAGDMDMRSEAQFMLNLKASTRETTEPGSNDKPILNFRAHLWRYLDRNRDTLNLDLFWPQPFDDDSESASDNSEANAGVLSIEEMRPLLEFRHLKSLQLSGMLVSYQKYIWQACWLNPGLEDLVLEMALEPEISKEYRTMWPKIEGDWTVRRAEGSTTYL